MNERAFRFDLLIAVAALLISSVAAGASVYQTRAIQEQYDAAIWPYLSIDSTESTNGVTLAITNDGLGPALVRSAQLYENGQPIGSWHQLFADVALDRQMPLGKVRTSTMSSLDASTTLRPGATETMITVTLAHKLPPAVLRRHVVTMDLCYCSLNDHCWLLHATPGRATGNYPHTTSDCTSTARIDS